MRRLTGGLALVVLVAVTVGLVITAVLRSSGTPDAGTSGAERSSTASNTPEPIDPAADAALFVGDSFTAGAGIEPTDKPYAYAVGAAFGWRVALDAQGGTGFLSDGRGTGNGDTSTLLDRLPADARTGPVDYLVVDAGRNDLGQPPQNVAAAVEQYLVAARAIWPEATFAFVMPAFLRDEPYDTYAELLRLLTPILAAVDATLVDPVAERWYEDIDVDSVTIDDRVHPNGAGNTLIGDRMIESLHRQGIGSL